MHPALRLLAALAILATLTACRWSGTIPNAPTPTPNTPTPTLSPPLAATHTALLAGPILGQIQIGAEDNGKIFRYAITMRFTIAFDERTHPRASLVITCSPQGTIGTHPVTIFARPPRYGNYYEALTPGTCTVQNRDVLITILVAPLPR